MLKNRREGGLQYSMTVTGHIGFGKNYEVKMPFSF
jgi:hypothetical protein